MDADKIAAVAGTLGLVHGGFGRADEGHETRLVAMTHKAGKGAASPPAWTSLGGNAISKVRRLLRGRRH